jgi:hypothetical protein
MPGDSAYAKGMETQASESADRAPEGYSIDEPSVCRIERWRGYRSSTFYARVGGRLVESRSFRWSKADPPPDTTAARAAYDELVARLEAAGWEPVAGGGLWYETSFVWAVSEGREVVGHVPVGRPEVPVAQPEMPVAQPEVPAPQTESPVAPVRPAAFRGFKPGKLLYAGVAACATLAVLALVLGTRGHAVTGRSPAPPGALGAGQAARASKVSSTGRAATAEAVRARSRQALVDLRIEARGTGSWLELRRVSGTGPVLYSGTLLPGTTLHFRAARIWARLGAAGNLVVTENGRPVQLQGTFDKLFLPPGR